MKENPWLKWIDEDSWEWFVFLIYLQENPFAWYTTPRFAIPIWLIAHNNIITILSQSCTSKLNVVQYDIFSRAQADVNLPNSIARKQHNNKKKKRIWRTTTNIRVLGIFLASTPSCEKKTLEFIWHCRLHLVPNSEECSPRVTLNNFEFTFWSHILRNDHEECSLCDILINFEFIFWSHILRNVYGGMFTRCYFEQLWAHFLLSHLLRNIHSQLVTLTNCEFNFWSLIFRNVHSTVSWTVSVMFWERHGTFLAGLNFELAKREPVFFVRSQSGDQP